MALSSTSFKPGAKPGPGRGKKTVEERSVLQLIRDGIAEDDVVVILREQVKRAKRGDPKSAALILAYRLGSPTQKIEHTGEVKVMIWDLPTVKPSA